MENKYLVVVEESNNENFEIKCNELLKDCYELKSCSTGFVNSEEYNFCSLYQAIFLKEKIYDS